MQKSILGERFFKGGSDFISTQIFFEGSYVWMKRKEG